MTILHINRKPQEMRIIGTQQLIFALGPTDYSSNGILGVFQEPLEKALDLSATSWSLKSKTKNVTFFVIIQCLQVIARSHTLIEHIPYYHG